MIWADFTTALLARRWVLWGPRWTLALGALLLAAGCTTVRTADGERVTLRSEEFKAYAERVFREHNGALDRLMFSLPELESTDAMLYARLSRAETEMLAACRRLNELASRYRDGRPPGGWRRLRAARSVASCDRATQATVAILPAH